MTYIFVLATLLTAWIFIRIVSRIGSPFPLDDRPAGSWFVANTTAPQRLSGPEEQWRNSLVAASSSGAKWGELSEQLDQLEATVIGPAAERDSSPETPFSAQALRARIDALERNLEEGRLSAHQGSTNRGSEGIE